MAFHIELCWSKFKSFLTTRNLEMLCFEDTTHYTLVGVDNGLTIACVVLRNGGSDVTDFEANYKANCNPAKA